MARRAEALSSVRITIYCLLLSLVSTLIGYGYGIGNQVELLPGTLRAINPGYLPRDFFVNTTDVFGPRLPYFRFVGFLGRLMGVGPASFVLVLLANFGTIYLTYRVAQKLFPTVRLSPAIAALFVCSNAFVHDMVGAAAKLTTEALAPEVLALPFCFLAVLLCLGRRYGLASLVLLAGSLFHPLAAAQFALVSFSASIFTEWRTKEMGKPLRPLGWLGLTAGIIYLVWIRPQKISLSDHEFFEILAYFRLPHHLLPSTFDRLEYVGLVLAVLAGALAFRSWAKRPSAFAGAQWVGSAAVLILILFGVDYLFVEVWPTRLILSAWFFRLSLLLHWLIILCIAFVAGRLMEIAMRRRTLMPLPLFVATGRATSAFFLAGLARFYPKSRVTPWLVLLAICFAVWIDPSRDFAQLLRLILGLVALAAVVPALPRMRTTLLLTAGGLSLAWILIVSSDVPGGVRSELATQEPIFSLNQVLADDSLADVIEYAKAQTPQGATFLVPPDQGDFRYLAGRAIVVDFKAFPFQDDAMAEWFRRMQDVYGPQLVLGNYWASMVDMKKRYVGISDDRLKQLSDKYGANYAVLDATTNTGYPVRFRGKRYMIVELAGPSPSI
jgi:hypothetical protein